MAETRRTADRERGRRPETEWRWPPLLALGIALVLYGALPSFVPTALRIAVVVAMVLLVAPVVAFSPTRIDRADTWSRVLSLAQAYVLLAANLVALGIVVRTLLQPHPAAAAGGGSLALLGALQVWLTNVIAFALVYWELDRGGPVVRRLRPRDRLPRADFLFPQDQTDDAVAEVAAGSAKRSGWVPAFVDYAYFSVSNSVAFSPTDVMPLTSRAKGLMALQALAGFLVVVLVIARGLSLLG